MAKDTFNLNEWVGNKERRLLKEDYNSYAEGQEKKLIDLLPDEEFTFNGKTYTFIELVPDHENTAIVKDSEGKERRITFGGGMVNTGEVSGTGVADMGQGKGHHIDEESLKERTDTEFFDSRLTLEKIVAELGYRDIIHFLDQNPGAVSAIKEFIFNEQEFRLKLGLTSDEDIYN